MSDATPFRLLLLAPEDVGRFIDFEDNDAPEGDALIKKRTTGFSRNGWFVSACRTLIAEAKLGDSIKFLSSERHTLTRISAGSLTNYRFTDEYRVVPPNVPEDRSAGHVAGHSREYTIIAADEMAAVARELEKLWAFCTANIETHILLSDYLSCRNAKDLLASMQFFSKLSDSPASDEGNTSDFFFFSLFSIKQLIAEAVDQHVAALYLNESMAIVTKTP